MRLAVDGFILKQLGLTGSFRQVDTKLSMMSRVIQYEILPLRTLM